MRPMSRRLMVALPALAAASTVVAEQAERPSEQALRRSLRDILASGYQLTPPVRVQIEEWLAWLLRSIGRLLSGLSEAGPLAGLPLWATWVIAGVLIALLVLILAHIVVTVRRALVEPSVRRDAATRRRRRENPRALLAAAEEALRRSEYDRAVRLLYRAALVRLDRLGVLTHDAARTNWENLRALRSEEPAVRDAMAELARAVDDTVYGGAAASRSTAERCRASVNALWRAEAAGS